ncbi:MAG: H-NS histone family protein [Candidatus Competibacteraceae bacterium]|nr:H-NS histone family protein [Candidatus Competibacteraceae bacterium]
MLQAVKINEIMGDVPAGPVEARLILPTIWTLSFDDLKYISSKVEEYQGEVQAMLEQKAEERLAELKARIAADQAELEALEPKPAKMANPSTPKYRDPEKPENTWAGRGKQPGWLKEKIDAGASLDDFLIDKPAVAEVDPEAGF